MTTNNKRSITARLNPTRKAKLEAMAGIYYQGAQADVIRRWIDEQFNIIFGDLDPTALLDGRVDETDARQVMKDVDVDADERIDAAGIDDDLRMDEDDQVAAVAQDGGTLTHQPERFETMLGPQELQQSGPALEWDELREIVADDGHWSETLEIHPDRVQPGTLKSNHKLTPRVIAAMARSIGGGGYVEYDDVVELVDEQLSHLHNRRVSKDGKQYIRNTYLPLVAEELIQHPNPTIDTLITESDTLRFLVGNNVSEPLGTFFDNETMLSKTRFANKLGENRPTKKTTERWKDELGDWLEEVATLQRFHFNYNLEELESEAEEAGEPFDYPESYDSVRRFIASLTSSLIDEFDEEVPDKTKKQILHKGTHTDDAVAEHIQEQLETRSYEKKQQ